MSNKPSPEGKVIAAHGAAVVAAFQVLINCLGAVSDMTLAVLHDILAATLN